MSEQRVLTARRWDSSHRARAGQQGMRGRWSASRTNTRVPGTEVPFPGTYAFSGIGYQVTRAW